MARIESDLHGRSAAALFSRRKYSRNVMQGDTVRSIVPPLTVRSREVSGGDICQLHGAQC